MFTIFAKINNPKEDELFPTLEMKTTAQSELPIIIGHLEMTYNVIQVIDDEDDLIYSKQTPDFMFTKDRRDSFETIDWIHFAVQAMRKNKKEGKEGES